MTVKEIIEAAMKESGVTVELNEGLRILNAVLKTMEN